MGQYFVKVSWRQSDIKNAVTHFPPPTSLTHTQILFGPPPLFWRCTQRFESCQHLLLFRTYVLCSSTNNYNMFPVNSLNTVLFSWLFLAQSPFVPVSWSKKRFVWRIVTPLYFLTVVILMAIPSGRSCAWIVWRTSQSSFVTGQTTGTVRLGTQGLDLLLIFICTSEAQNLMSVVWRFRHSSGWEQHGLGLRHEISNSFLY